MRGWIKALPLGLILPVMLWAASVKPEDAASNISAWAKWGTTILYVSMGAAALYSMAVWVVPAVWTKQGHEQIRVFAIAGLVAALLCGGLYVARLTPRKQEAAKTTPISQTVSTIGKTIFRCPRPMNIDERDPKEVRAETAENLRAMGEIFGLSIDVRDITNGMSMVVTASTDEGRLRMGAAEKWNLEVRRSGAELLVFSHMQMPSVFGMIADLMSVDPKSEAAISETKMIERLLAVPPSSCRLM
jgi:hypothetical protein